MRDVGNDKGWNRFGRSTGPNRSFSGVSRNALQPRPPKVLSPILKKAMALPFGDHHGRETWD